MSVRIRWIVLTVVAVGVVMVAFLFWANVPTVNTSTVDSGSLIVDS